MRAPFDRDSPNLWRDACTARAMRTFVRRPTASEDDKSFCVIGTLDDLHVHPRHHFCHGAAKQRALIAAIGVEFHQERIHAEHGRHYEYAAVAILNVSGMNDGMNQQALRIDENMPLLALDPAS